MTIQFPDSPTQDDSFVASNGVSYTYDKGGWIANSQLGLDDRFVNADGDQMTGDLTVPSLNGGQLAGFRNQLINGGMNVWQRGTTGFTTSAYSADRWNSGVNTSTLKNTERAIVGGDVSALPESLIFALKTTVTTSGAVDSYVALDQPIEGVRTYAGQEVTLSFYASADSALSISSEAVQYFGKDPGVSTAVSSIGVQKHQLVANTWTRFSKTFTLPSVAGKVISNSDSLKVNFWFDAGSNLNSRTDSLGNQSGTFYITGIQLEPGPVATPFEHRPIGTELALCQRYYQTVSAANATIGVGGYAAAATQDQYCPVVFPVTMRVAPAISNVLGPSSLNTSGTMAVAGTPSVNGVTLTVKNQVIGSWNFYVAYDADAEL